MREPISPIPDRPLFGLLDAWIDRQRGEATIRAQRPGYRRPFAVGDSGWGHHRPDVLLIGEDFAELICAEDRWTLRHSDAEVRWRTLGAFAAGQPKTHFSIRSPRPSLATVRSAAHAAGIPPSRVKAFVHSQAPEVTVP